MSLGRNHSKRNQAGADSDWGGLPAATRPESLHLAPGTKVRIEYFFFSGLRSFTELTGFNTRVKNRPSYGRDHARVDSDRDCAFRLCCRSRTAEVRTPSLSLCFLTAPHFRCRKLTVVGNWRTEPTFSGTGRVSPCCSDLCTFTLPPETLMTSQPRPQIDPHMDFKP